MFKSIRHMARLSKIAFSLIRRGALFDMLEIFGGQPKLITRFRASKKDSEENNLVEAFQALGPCFIKFGQALATRPDIIGAAVARDLMRLQDQVPSFDSAHAKRIITEDLGAPIEELFAEFEDEPVAAASIAQVHIATDHQGRKLAVKVLRPDITKKFERDLAAFMWLARLSEKVSRKAKRLSPTEIVETIAESISLELDLRYEAAAAVELHENMADNPDYNVPAVHWDKTARRVMTSSWVEGIPFSQPEKIDAANYDKKKLATCLVQAFLGQALNDGFFHADLHQGNLFACEGSKITAIDFGIMGRLDRKDRRALAEILYGFINKDYDMVAKAHFDVGYVPKDQNYIKFKQALRMIGEPVVNRPVEEISAGRLLGLLFETTETFNMKTQPQLILLQKTMVTVEGVALALYPEINMWETAQPIIKKWIKKNLGPEGIVKEAAGTALEVITKLPKAINDMENIAAGIHKFLEDAEKRQQNNPFKMAFYGLIVGMLICTTAFLMYIK